MERPRDQTSRRKMLVRAAAGLAAAGALLEARGAAAQAATGSPFILGVPNDANTTTELGPTPGFSPNPTLQIDAGGAATAVKGTSSGGFGAIRAENAGAGPGVVGTSVGNAGVVGIGGTGVVGNTTVSGGIGVAGSGAPGGTGVNGFSDTNVGVQGDSTSGIGVNGGSSGAGNTGTARAAGTASSAQPSPPPPPFLEPILTAASAWRDSARTSSVSRAPPTARIRACWGPTPVAAPGSKGAARADPAFSVRATAERPQASTDRTPSPLAWAFGVLPWSHWPPEFGQRMRSVASPSMSVEKRSSPPREAARSRQGRTRRRSRTRT